MAPYLIAFKLGFADRQKSKEKLLAAFFSGVPKNLFDEQAAKFADTKIPELIRKDAKIILEKYLKEGVTIVIVSASPSAWIMPWSEKNGYHHISTELDQTNNIISGRISGKNCYGEEKVRRIKEKYNLEEYNEIYAFGDSRGDLPMLSIAHKKFYKPFRD